MEQNETIRELTEQLREKDEFIESIRKYLGEDNFLEMKELLR